MVKNGEWRSASGAWRRRMRAPILVLSAILLTPITIRSQEVGLTATAPVKELRMGETVEVTVEARVPATIDSIGPIKADSAGLFQIFSISRREDGHAWKFELMTVDTGSVFLPPLAFGYAVKGDTVSHTAYANSLLFTVHGVDLPAGAEIKDIKPPLRAAWKWEDVWPYLAVLALVVAGLFAYRRFRKKPSAPAEEVPIPSASPHVQALRELRLLEEKKLWQQGKVKEYYSDVTEIIRRFFEGRWQFPALEMTSDEILARPEVRVSDVAGQRKALEQFFRRADLVKFAKGLPDAEDHQKEMATAYAVVRAMTPAPEPVRVEPAVQETADVR